MGVVSVDEGPQMPVYQCDECIAPGEVMGATMDLALTFCVDAEGRMFNPADPDEPFSLN
jgi:hypothetical protein